MVSLVVSIGALVYFVWGIFPAIKENVEAPTLPPRSEITTAEIQEYLNQKSKKEVPAKAEETKKKNKTEKGVKSEQEKRLDVLIDSIKVLLPNKIYSWQDIGHKEGYWYTRRVIDRSGLFRKLAYLLEDVDSVEAKIERLDVLIKIVSNYSIEDRAKVADAFFKIFFEKEKARKTTVREQKESYEQRKSLALRNHEESMQKKEVARTQGMMAVGMTLSSVAIIAVLLVVLGIYRQIKIIAERKE
jgi:hypothetical protein